MAKPNDMAPLNSVMDVVGKCEGEDFEKKFLGEAIDGSLGVNLLVCFSDMMFDTLAERVIQESQEREFLQHLLPAFLVVLFAATLSRISWCYRIKLVSQYSRGTYRSITNPVQ
ncbi:hypothetical protein FRB94_001143 [Tulasnella sp. JGI-2019a]|nr:hypothetical protein FRB94_001143 [Tulasnella sp. JGI-2019a]